MNGSDQSVPPENYDLWDAERGQYRCPLCDGRVLRIGGYAECTACDARFQRESEI